MLTLDEMTDLLTDAKRNIERVRQEGFDGQIARELDRAAESADLAQQLIAELVA